MSYITQGWHGLVLYSFVHKISISSYSHNLLQFLQFRYYTLYRRKEENLEKTLPPSLSFKKSIQKRQLYVHEFSTRMQI